MDEIDTANNEENTRQSIGTFRSTKREEKPTSEASSNKKLHHYAHGHAGRSALRIRRVVRCTCIAQPHFSWQRVQGRPLTKRLKAFSLTDKLAFIALQEPATTHKRSRLSAVLVTSGSCCGVCCGVHRRTSPSSTSPTRLAWQTEA